MARTDAHSNKKETENQTNHLFGCILIGCQGFLWSLKSDPSAIIHYRQYHYRCGLDSTIHWSNNRESHTQSDNTFTYPHTENVNPCVLPLTNHLHMLHSSILTNGSRLKLQSWRLRNNLKNESRGEVANRSRQTRREPLCGMCSWVPCARLRERRGGGDEQTERLS